MLEGQHRAVDRVGVTSSNAPCRIDLHAHLFNAYDVPVSDFIERAVRPAGNHPRINAWIGALLEWYARRSPTAEHDARCIRDRITPHRAAFDLAEPTGRVRKLLELPAQIWQYSRMINEARRSRLVMLRNLDGYVTGPVDEIDLYVSLAVDMELGAGGSGRATPLEQFDVMALLSEATLRSAMGISGVMLPMIGYDPRRPDGHARNDFEQVQRRVCRGDAIGIKLYPPMGFFPLGNGGAVDERLRRLYEWCVANEVPITAHCSPANAVDPAAGHACPERWEPVLNEFIGLRLNLAHVGGIGRNGWATQAIKLIADHLGSGTFVSAEVSNHDVADEAAMKAFIDALKASASRFAETRADEVMSRLAFGTDYWFLYMHRDPKTFMERYAAAIRAAFPEQATLDSFLGGAARCFLFGDAAKPNANRQRVIDRVERLQRNEFGPFVPPPSFNRALGLDDAWKPQTA